MMPSSLADAFSRLPAVLAESAVRSLVLACGAAVALAALRVKGAAQRLAVWRFVLCAALAMPALGWIVPALPFSLPAPQFGRETPSAAADSVRPQTMISSAAPAVRAPAKKQNGEVHSQSDVPPVMPAPYAQSRPVEAAPAPGIWAQGKAVAGAVYAVVATIFLARFLLGLALSRRLERAARTIDDPRVTGRLQFFARSERLKKTPRVAESRIALVPMTLGVREPAILLPAAWRAWDDTELDAVMAHEVSHVARRDALAQRLSLLHRALFWFSPLGWWLDRRLAELAEQASDEAALAQGANRARYAQTLLGFFSQLESSSGRMRWQGVSMATSGNAERRLDRILAWKGGVSSKLGKSLALSLAIIGPPVVLLAAGAHPIFYYQAQNPPAPRAPLPPPAAVPAPAAVPVPWVQPAPYAIPPVAVAPVPPVAPVASSAPFALQSKTDFVIADDDGQSFVISYGKNYAYVSRHGMSVSSSGDADSDEIGWLRNKISGDFIWFWYPRDDKYYVIRDQATIKRAWELFEPARALGEKQEELGKQQEALGEQQEALGEKMSEVKVKIPDMTAELEKVRAKMKELANGGTQEELGELQEELGELQGRIGELQSEAGREQSKIGRQQGELGRRQGELGRQQGEIGRQQGELSRKATREMRSLLDDAVSKGLAKPE